MRNSLIVYYLLLFCYWLVVIVVVVIGVVAGGVVIMFVFEVVVGVAHRALTFMFCFGLVFVFVFFCSQDIPKRHFPCNFKRFFPCLFQDPISSESLFCVSFLPLLLCWSLSIVLLLMFACLSCASFCHSKIIGQTLFQIHLVLFYFLFRFFLLFFWKRHELQHNLLGRHHFQKCQMLVLFKLSFLFCLVWISLAFVALGLDFVVVAVVIVLFVAVAFDSLLLLFLLLLLLFQWEQKRKNLTQTWTT